MTTHRAHGQVKVHRRTFSLPLFGANWGEFWASFLVPPLSLVLIDVFTPVLLDAFLQRDKYITSYIVCVACHLPVALTSLFCAINAYRDPTNNVDKRAVALVWGLVLCLWMSLCVHETLYWVSRLNPPVFNLPARFKNLNRGPGERLTGYRACENR